MKLFEYCIVVLLLGVFTSRAEGTGPKAPAAPILKYAESECIVRFNPDVSEKRIREINRELGVSVLSQSHYGQFWRIQVPPGENIQNLLVRYMELAEVAYAEPNYISTAHFLSKDSLFSHLNNKNGTSINIKNAWDLQNDANPKVVVAILDGGIAYEDSGVYKKASRLSTVTFVAGYDFVNNDTHPNDDNGHGTHICELITQNPNNVKGPAGIAYGTSIMPLKVLNAFGRGKHSWIADGIRFAADNGAQIINMGFGGPPSQTLFEAIAYAAQKNVIIIASAGNDSTKGTVSYPAAYDDYVLAVGATGFDEERAPYSTVGLYLDIVAPGSDLSVDQNEDGYPDGILQQSVNSDTLSYRMLEGTSVAAARVSSIAASLLANGFYSEHIRLALQSTAHLGNYPEWNPKIGWGRVNARKALQYRPEPASNITITDVSSLSPWYLLGEAIPITVALANHGVYEASVEVEIITTVGGDTVGKETIPTIVPGESVNVNFVWNTTAKTAPGDHFLKVYAHVAEDEFPANNVVTKKITVRADQHDLAIEGVSPASFSVQSGTSLPIKIHVSNRGSFIEQATIMLSMGDTQIASRTITLQAGGSSLEHFTWNTSGIPIATYRIKATVRSETTDAVEWNNDGSAFIIINGPPKGPKK